MARHSKSTSRQGRTMEVSQAHDGQARDRNSNYRGTCLGSRALCFMPWGAGAKFGMVPYEHMLMRVRQRGPHFSTRPGLECGSLDGCFCCLSCSFCDILFRTLHENGMTFEIFQVKEAFDLFDVDGTQRINPRDLRACVQSPLGRNRRQ